MAIVAHAGLDKSTVHIDVSTKQEVLAGLVQSSAAMNCGRAQLPVDQCEFGFCVNLFCGGMVRIDEGIDSWRYITLRIIVVRSSRLSIAE